jgi:hypothetical protein
MRLSAPTDTQTDYAARSQADHRADWVRIAASLVVDELAVADPFER